MSHAVVTTAGKGSPERAGAVAGPVTAASATAAGTVTAKAGSVKAGAR